MRLFPSLSADISPWFESQSPQTRFILSASAHNPIS